MSNSESEKDSDDSVWWFLKGTDIIHRDDGPAIEWADGATEWYKNNLHHREDGPACEWPNGDKEWWFQGKRIDCNSQEEFEMLMKLRAFW